MSAAKSTSSMTAAARIEANDSSRFHLVLLARNNEGFLNLVRLVNKSWLKNSFRGRRGLVDWRLLKEYHRGSDRPQRLLLGISAPGLSDRRDGSGRKRAERYLDIFGPHFYPELGRHGVPEEEEANRGLIELSRRFDLRPVVTNDCHYPKAADWRIHDILIRPASVIPPILNLTPAISI